MKKLKPVLVFSYLLMFIIGFAFCVDVCAQTTTEYRNATYSADEKFISGAQLVNWEHLSNLHFQIVFDLDGSIWLATEKGAINISRNGKVTVYDKSKGLADDLVTQIVIGPDGSKWFVHSGVIRSGGGLMTVAYGVSQLKKDGTIKIFSYDKGLPSSMVYGITFDKDNTVWLATNEGAVNLRVGGKIKVFTVKDGLPDSDVRYIYVDNKGIRWFSTSKGTARMGLDGKVSVVYK